MNVNTILREVPELGISPENIAKIPKKERLCIIDRLPLEITLSIIRKRTLDFESKRGGFLCSVVKCATKNTPYLFNRIVHPPEKVDMKKELEKVKRAYHLWDSSGKLIEINNRYADDDMRETYKEMNELDSDEKKMIWTSRVHLKYEQNTRREFLNINPDAYTQKVKKSWKDYSLQGGSERAAMILEERILNDRQISALFQGLRTSLIAEVAGEKSRKMKLYSERTILNAEEEEEEKGVGQTDSLFSKTMLEYERKCSVLDEGDSCSQKLKKKEHGIRKLTLRERFPSACPIFKIFIGIVDHFQQ